MQQWILGVVAVGGLGAGAVGDVINVPEDFPTIQAAVNAAQDGDEVVVGPGTYAAVDFEDKAITIRSSGGPGVTTIDGAGTQWVVEIDNNQEGHVLQGFAITGASGAGLRLAHGPNTLVLNCVFAGNEGPNGAGILVDNSGGGSIEARNCVFSGNTAIMSGGAVSLWRPGLFVGCVFNGNVAAENGGAVSVKANNDHVFIRCAFVDNEAKFGGAVFNPQRPLFVNCAFLGNHASHAGGAVMNEGQVSCPLITNCTFVANEATIGGGALFNSNFSLPTIHNSVLWSNVPDQVFDNISLTTIRFSDIEGGWPGIGNIDADPLFVDPVGADYRLQSGSPAIDAGHNNAIADLADTDLEGNPRFADGPAKDTGCGIPVLVDMGAYEFQGDPFPVKLGDLDGDGAVGVLDFLALLAEWGLCPEDCCLADLDLDGDVGVTDFLTLLGNWSGPG